VDLEVARSSRAGGTNKNKGLATNADRTKPSKKVCRHRVATQLMFVIPAFIFAIMAWSPAIAQTPTHAPPAGMTCPGDRLVWVNTPSGVYHFQGERYFGSTKTGKFLCQHEADQEGDRPRKNGQ
jgi:hypothetical protein